MKIAVIGSGPAALFALEQIRKQENTQVDVLERWPFPFGLVRYGVSPDHQGVKNIQRSLARHLAADNVRFLGGITIGKDLSINELRQHYNAILLGIGAEQELKLGLNGEDLPQVWGSGQFAGWYNAHPDHRQSPPLGEKVALIGQGNVAMDAARVLLLSPEEFSGSDLGLQPTQDLKHKPVREVAMYGRRGPAEAKFTTPELREICKINGVRVSIEGIGENVSDTKTQLKSLLDSLDEARFPTPADFRRVRGNLETMLAVLQESTQESPEKEGEREGEGKKEERILRFVFAARPLAFIAHSDGQGDAKSLSGIQFARTSRADNGKWQETNQKFTDPCNFAVSCIGYRTLPLEDVPYNEKRGTYDNQNGRISQGLWAVGWCKRGPSGAIATNRKESHAVAEAMLAESGKSTSPEKPSIDNLLKTKKIHAINWSDWLRIEKAEELRAPPNRIREKFTSTNDAVKVVQG
ncbi:MAG: hypothetical protein OD811_02695 [Alphaproteobacteria bacterium]